MKFTEPGEQDIPEVGQEKEPVVFDWQLPPAAEVEDLIETSRKRGASRVSTRLTEGGKQFVQERLDDWLDSVDISFESMDWVDQVQESLRAAVAQREQAEPDLTDQERHFYSLVERSLSFRVERLRQLDILERVNAGGDDLRQFMTALHKRHPSLPEALARNAALPIIGKIDRAVRQAVNEHTLLVQHRIFEHLTIRLQEESSLDLEEAVTVFIQQSAPEVVPDELVPEMEQQINEEDIPLDEPTEPWLHKVWQKWQTWQKKVPRMALSALFGLTLLSATTNNVNTSSAAQASNYQVTLQETLRASPDVGEEREQNLAPNGLTVSELLPQLNQEFVFAPNELLLDETYVHAGSELYTQDIEFRVDRLTRMLQEGGPDVREEFGEQYTNTIKLLLSGKSRWPQAVKFKMVSSRDGLRIEPIDYSSDIEITESKEADVVVVGGELESITTAIEADNQGRSVTMVYAGPLGGLSADNGGNMRFFDAVTSVGMTAAQQEVMQALDMTEGNYWSIPDHVHEKLAAHLAQKRPNITLVATDTYNSLHITSDSTEGRPTIKEIVTEEGVQVGGNYFIDTEPEAVLADKLGLPSDVETPNIAYGLVIDLVGVEAEDLDSLTEESARLRPEAIMEYAGISPEVLANNPKLQASYNNLQAAFAKTTHLDNQYCSWGYAALGKGYTFYMQCQEAVATGKEKGQITNLNEQRRMDGFNVAHREGSVTLNSISYHFSKRIKQHDHDIQKDPEFVDIRTVEKQHLTEYFRYVTGKKDVGVRLPNQLYVRQAAASYKTATKYGPDAFQTVDESKPVKDELSMRYHVDLREAVPRDEYDEVLSKIQKVGDEKGLAEWKINPATAYSGDISNLFLVNKSAAENEFVGNLRIIQNLMGTGVAVVRSLDSITKQAGASANTSAESEYEIPTWVTG